MPGLFSKEQIAAWKTVTASVHQGHGRIFVQLMHTGRIGHPLNLPKGAELLGPLADPDPATFYTPGVAGYTDYSVLAR
jgi:N-ethylmaleimide reductase